MCAALQHQNSFDVCWCRGSVAERIFAPLVTRIKASGGKVLGGQRVTSLDTAPDGAVRAVTATCASGLPPLRCLRPLLF